MTRDNYTVKDFCLITEIYDLDQFRALSVFLQDKFTPDTRIYDYGSDVYSKNELKQYIDLPYTVFDEINGVLYILSDRKLPLAKQFTTESNIRIFSKRI